MAVIKYEKRYTVPNDQLGIKDFVATYAKPCYGKCDRCVWKNNGGCSEWPEKTE